MTNTYLLRSAKKNLRRAALRYSLVHRYFSIEYGRKERKQALDNLYRHSEQVASLLNLIALGHR